ncbi:MAG TPA: hypothetical protein VJM50_18500 [Pyrinomonadaceae bacterium]|nr:hypothetical protein [Pyrinomonadaceae bacterium]
MPTQREYQYIYEQIAALREFMVEEAGDAARDPAFADALTRRLDAMLEVIVAEDIAAPPPPDAGFANLIGLGNNAARDLGDTRIPQRVEEYDEKVASERIIAVGDLYYIYQHEQIGVFRVLRKLKELFEAGTLRLSQGAGAFGLYQYDKRDVLRYTQRDRLAAYRRVLGYGSGPVPAGASPNNSFHGLFTNFVNEVTQFWRDKRISDVIRERSDDPSFGSIATVRRAGLDLRNNLKWASYGHVNVMRVEVMQVLDDAFRILNADDVKSQFGAENAWDVIEEVLTRYFGESLTSSTRQRMGVTGRDILRWLGSKFILQAGRTQFEAELRDIADDAEEWLTSAETLGVARRRPSSRGGKLPWDRQRRSLVSSTNGNAREFEFELEI